MCVLSGYVRGVRATCTMIHLAVNATQQREIVLQYSIHSSFVDSVCSRCGARKLPSFVCVCVWLLCMHAYKCACAKVHYNPLLNFFCSSSVFCRCCCCCLFVQSIAAVHHFQVAEASSEMVLFAMETHTS